MRISALIDALVDLEDQHGNIGTCVTFHTGAHLEVAVQAITAVGVREFCDSCHTKYAELTLTDAPDDAFYDCEGCAPHEG